MAETVNHGNNNPGAAGDGQQQDRTFTQSELDAIVRDRLSREHSKYADYDVLREKAAKFDAAEEAGKTELQKAQDHAADLQKQVDKLTAAENLRRLRAKVSKETGVPEALLNADTEDACTAQAKAILEFARPGTYPTVKDGGEPQNKPSGSTRDQFADWFAQAMK